MHDEGSDFVRRKPVRRTRARAMMDWLHWPNVNWALIRTPASLLCSAPSVATGSRCCFGTGLASCFSTSGWSRASSLAGHDEGGRTWARIASLIETCKLNNVEPYAYLKSTIEANATGHPAARIKDAYAKEL